MCRSSFDAGADLTGFHPSLAETVERRYFAENFPFEPFGDVFEHAPDADRRRERSRARQRRRAGVDDGNSSEPVPAVVDAPTGKDEL